MNLKDQILEELKKCKFGETYCYIDVKKIAEKLNISQDEITGNLLELAKEKRVLLGGNPNDEEAVAKLLF